MTQISESVTHLIDQLSRLPGIGRKTAERLAYHLLRVQESEAMELATAIQGMRQNVHYCEDCYNLAEQDKCQVCLDTSRDSTMLCIVEQPRDVISLEQAGVYNGLYHVLLGRIAPLEGIGPEHLMIESLVRRVRTGSFKEIILATNPTVEGDGTALHVSNLLGEMPVQITRLARGITTGSILEHTNKEILADALSGRREY
jgi:recombination protein RecR